MNRETTVQQLSEVQSEKNRTETMVFNTIDCLNIAYAQWDAELRFLYGNRRWLTAFQHYLHEDSTQYASVFDFVHRLVETKVIVVPEDTTTEVFEEQILEAIHFRAQGFDMLLSAGLSLSLYVHPAPEGGCITYFRENDATTEANHDRNQSVLARSRLTEALDAIDESFVLYDKNDRLILANRAVKELNPSTAHLMTYGRPRKEVLEGWSRGSHLIDTENWKEYCKTVRDGTVATPGRQFELKCTDGRIFLASSARTSEGGSTITWKEVTESKKSEERARAIAIDAMEGDSGGFLYFSEASSGTVSRVELSGDGIREGTVQTLVSRLTDPMGVALEPNGGRRLFFTLYGGSIRAVARDGSGDTGIPQVTQLEGGGYEVRRFDSGTRLDGIAISASESAGKDPTELRLYWSESGRDHALKRSSLDGTRPESILVADNGTSASGSGLAWPRGLALGVGSSAGLLICERLGSVRLLRELAGGAAETVVGEDNYPAAEAVQALIKRAEKGGKEQMYFMGGVI